MRVIAGKARGHRLKPPEGTDIRPTSDRVKESVFNIIQNHVVDGVVVDLFSGTGNLGIEALSRGATKAYFVDQSKKSIEIIKYNLEKTRLYQDAVVLNLEAVPGIVRLAGQQVKADLILMDPPYDKGLIEPTLESIFSNRLLRDQGMIVIEHDRNEKIQEEIHGLVCVRKKDYGNTSISFYQLREDI